jgi:M6 family metalloprotease-like protein
MRPERLCGCILILLALLSPSSSAIADDFLCAGTLSPGTANQSPKRAPIFTQYPTTGTGNALVLFARFHGEETGGDSAPTWSREIFDPQQPGSFSHFYDTMSFGKLRMRGEVASRYYESTRTASAYLADSPGEFGQFGQFAVEILQQADRDIDFTRFDNDGPDGIPDSGDDDGWVDALFLVLPSVPESFLLDAATGIGNLGLAENWETDDAGASGEPIRIASTQGSILGSRTFAETVGSMCHEYGHLLGLPDLYAAAYLQSEETAPEGDSAGIGAWGLMGWGALGWNGNDGPTAFSAWSRMQLGWAQMEEPTRERTDLELEDVGIQGKLSKLPLNEKEYFLLEHRRRASTYYDRHLPAEGLLIWHVDQIDPFLTTVDLECADGKWLDAGYPLGQQPASHAGGDNLDFWAHDRSYASSHGGNQGDATDPFDGVRFRAFTPETNPASRSHDGQTSIRIEDIRIEEEIARATIETAPAQLELTQVYFADVGTDEVVVAGQDAIIDFRVANQGGFRLTELTVRISSDDPLVETPDPEVELADLEVGREVRVAMLTKEGYPRVRIGRDFTGIYRAKATLGIYSRDILLASRELNISAQESYSLSGFITDGKGKGIGGIEIRIWGQKIPRLITQTRKDGFYELFLLEDTYSMTVNSGGELGFAAQDFDMVISQDEIFSIDLLKAHRVSGVVRDSGGNPVPGVSVEGHGNGIYETTTTAPDGSYVLPLPRGVYYIRVVSYSDETQFLPFTVDDVRIEGETQLDLDQPFNVSVTLEIVAEDGVAIAGAQAYLYRDEVPNNIQGVYINDSQTARTDARGRVNFRIFPAEPHRLSLSSLPLSVVRPANIAIQASADTTIQIVLEKGIAVTGRVLYSEGNPVASGSLSIYPVETDKESAFVSILAGRFSIALEPGLYQVRYANAPFSGYPPNQELGIIEVQEEMEIDFIIDRGLLLKGRIHDDQGNLLTNARLEFFPLKEGNWQGCRLMDGIYQVGLFPGSYRTIFYPFGSTESICPTQELDIQIIDGDENRDLTVQRGLAVEGRLDGIEEVDLTGYRIEAVSLDAPTRGRASLQSDGTFRLWLLPGRYQINWMTNTSSAGTSWSGGEIQVPTQSPILLQHPSAVTLSGRIADRTGRPLESSLLLAHIPHPFAALFDQWQENFAAHFSSDSDGTYRIQMHPGRYDFVIFKKMLDRQRLGWVWRDVDLAESREEDITFPDPMLTHRVSGTILDHQNRLLPLGDIQFYDENSGFVGHAWVTPGTGKYAVDIPPGRYHATVGVSNYIGRYSENHYLGILQLTADTEWNVHLSTGETAIDEVVGALPSIFALHPNFPNPFNAHTAIPYQLPQTGRVQLTIYNIAGQQVTTLVDAQKPAGRHQIFWNGRDASGKQVGSGLYFYRLSTDTQTQTRRMILVK